MQQKALSAANAASLFFKTKDNIMAKIMFALVILLFGLAAAGDRAKWWLADGGNFERTGYKAESLEIAPFANFKEVWRCPVTPIEVDLFKTFLPIIYNDNIYFFNGDIKAKSLIDCTELYVIDAATGAVKMYRNYTDLWQGQCLSATTAFVGYEDGILYAHQRYYSVTTALASINMATLDVNLTGTQSHDKWTGSAMPGVASNRLGAIYAVEPTMNGGSQLDTYETPSGENKFPPVMMAARYNGLSLYNDQRIFALDGERHKLDELDPETGAIIWSYQFLGKKPVKTVLTHPVIADDFVVLVDTQAPADYYPNSRLIVIDVNTKKEVWSTSGKGCAANMGDVYRPAYDGKYFYMNCQDSIQAYAKKDGKEWNIYKCPPGRCVTVPPFMGQPVVTDDFLFVLTTLGRVVAFHKESGLFVAETNLPFSVHRPETRLAYYNGTIYVALGDGKTDALYAYRLDTTGVTTGIIPTTRSSSPGISRNKFVMLLALAFALLR